MTRLFFDAACFIAAAGRPDGGSGFLLSVCRHGYLRCAASLPVLQEAERNIGVKLGTVPLDRFYDTLAAMPMIVAPVPPGLQHAPALAGLNEKDRHVVAAALAVAAAYLITLDRPLIAEIRQAQLSFEAMLPGEFITTVLIAHVDYPSMRT